MFPVILIYNLKPLAEKGYEDTLDNLIKLTFRNVQEHVTEGPSIVSAIAQKVSPGVKIDASIA